MIAKARQLGLSWLVAIYALWVALFRDGAKILMLSQGEKEAWDLLDKCRFVHNRLPTFLKEPLDNDTRSVMRFTNGSIIEALPSTDKAGRSTDATLVIRDETANHPYGGENYVAISPTIDSGAQLIDLSTVNKFDSENHFTGRINRALNGSTVEYPLDNSDMEVHRGGESGATLIFGGWKLRPVRDEGLTLEGWFKVIQKKYEPIEIEQEYPTTLEEMLSTPQASCRFNTDILKAMETECINPIYVEYNGKLKVYKEPIADRKYCLIIDSSSGEVDPSVGKIIDTKTNDVSACWHGKISTDEQAKIGFDLYERYFKPFTAVERNGAGVLLIDKLTEMGVNNWYYLDESMKKKGFWMGSNRGKTITELAEWVRNREFREPDLMALDEFNTFMRLVDKNGIMDEDGRAVKGKHDDHVMVWAMYTQVLKKTIINKGRFISTKSRATSY